MIKYFKIRDKEYLLQYDDEDTLLFQRNGWNLEIKPGVYNYCDKYTDSYKEVIAFGICGWKIGTKPDYDNDYFFRDDPFSTDMIYETLDEA